MGFALFAFFFFLRSCSLQDAIADGGTPFFVGATAGTTVLGAYDPFNEIAAICDKHKLWFHIDACWGGSALLSKKWRHCLDGADKANSIAWNPHKMLGTALQSSIFLVRDTEAEGNLLKKVNGAQLWASFPLFSFGRQSRIFLTSSHISLALVRISLASCIISLISSFWHRLFFSYL
jgi:hypothetical protein